MRIGAIILIAAVVFLPFCLPAETVEERLLQEDAFARMAAEVGPAVVSVNVVQVYSKKVQPFRSRDPYLDRYLQEFFETPMEYRQSGVGSGVIIDEQGYILTNEHVVGSADEIEVVLSDGRKFQGVIQGTDPLSDLAVIKIEADNLPVAKLGNSDTVKTGQWVMAIGNPFGAFMSNPQPTITVGVVSALHRSFSYRGMDQHRYYGNLIQTDAAINRGNSGGPLVNLAGEVIGISAIIYSTTGGYQGIGFAIPINRAKRVLDELVAGEKVKYGWLGVQVQPLTPELVSLFNFPDDKGALVADIVADSPAEKYGLKKGYLVRRIDDKVIDNPNDLVDLVTHLEVGQQVNIIVWHDGREIPVKVTIGERPGEKVAVSRKKTAVAEAGWRGIQVSALTPEWKKQLDYSFNNGVVVIDVSSGSPAQKVGIQEGDVIDEVNRQQVNNLKEFNKLTGKLKGEVLLHTSRGYYVVKE